MHPQCYTCCDPNKKYQYKATVKPHETPINGHKPRKGGARHGIHFFFFADLDSGWNLAAVTMQADMKIDLTCSSSFLLGSSFPSQFRAIYCKNSSRAWRLVALHLDGLFSIILGLIKRLQPNRVIDILQISERNCLPGIP